MSLVGNSGFLRLRPFLLRLELLQETIRQVCSTWEPIAGQAFDDAGDARRFVATTVREGVVRDLVLTLCQGRSRAGLLQRALSNKGLRSLPNHHQILTDWFEQFPESGKAPFALMEKQVKDGISDNESEVLLRAANKSQRLRILILNPDPAGLELLTSMLKSLGHIIEEAPTDRAAVRFMERNPINLVLASVDPGDAEALELLTYVRRKLSYVPVILMFARVYPERAKEALRLGAMAVLKYPVPAAELRAAVLQALEQCEAAPIDTLDQPAGAAGAFGPGLAARPLATVTAQAQPPCGELFPNNRYDDPAVEQPPDARGRSARWVLLGGHRSKAGKPARGCRSPRGVGAGNRPGHRRSRP